MGLLKIFLEDSCLLPDSFIYLSKLIKNKKIKVIMKKEEKIYLLLIGALMLLYFWIDTPLGV